MSAICSSVGLKHGADRYTLAGRLLNVWAGTQRLEPTRGRGIGWNPKPVEIKEHLNESIDAVLDKMHQKS